MDTSPLNLVSRLELLRADATQMAMAARSIVERLDVVGQIRERKLAVLVDVLFDPFFLQTAEE